MGPTKINEQDSVDEEVESVDAGIKAMDPKKGNDEESADNRQTMMTQTIGKDASEPTKDGDDIEESAEDANEEGLADDIEHSAEEANEEESGDDVEEKSVDSNQSIQI